MTDTIHTATTAASDTAVPDIGDTFYRDDHRFVVTAWLRQVPLEPLPDDLAELFTEAPATTPPMVFCPREEAEYVAASAGHGALVPVAEITVTGRADWPDAHHDYARRRAALAVGRFVRPYGVGAVPGRR